MGSPGRYPINLRRAWRPASCLGGAEPLGQHCAARQPGSRAAGGAHALSRCARITSMLMAACLLPAPPVMAATGAAPACIAERRRRPLGRRRQEHCRARRRRRRCSSVRPGAAAGTFTLSLNLPAASQTRFGAEGSSGAASAECPAWWGSCWRPLLSRELKGWPLLLELQRLGGTGSLEHTARRQSATPQRCRHVAEQSPGAPSRAARLPRAARSRHEGRPLGRWRPLRRGRVDRGGVWLCGLDHQLRGLR